MNKASHLALFFFHFKNRMQTHFSYEGGFQPVASSTTIQGKRNDLHACIYLLSKKYYLLCNGKKEMKRKIEEELVEEEEVAEVVKVQEVKKEV